MVELFNEGKPVDLVTLQERLKEKDVPPEISSLEFVRDLVNAVPTSANVKYYAEIVADKAMMRKLIKLTESIANTCYVGKESLPVIMEQTEKSVFEIITAPQYRRLCSNQRCCIKCAGTNRESFKE